MSLMAHPNAKHTVATPINPDLNETLGRVESEVLDKGGDPVALLDKVQVEFASRLKE
jgi:hypothetical protein